MADLGLDGGGAGLVASPSGGRSTFQNRPAGGEAAGPSIEELLGGGSSNASPVNRNPRSIVTQGSGSFGGGAAPVGTTQSSSAAMPVQRSASGTQNASTAPPAAVATYPIGSSGAGGGVVGAAATSSSVVGATPSAVSNGKPQPLNPFDRPAAAASGGRFQPSNLDDFGMTDIADVNKTGAAGGAAGDGQVSHHSSSPRSRNNDAAGEPPAPPPLISLDDQVYEFHENLRHHCIALAIISFCTFVISFVQVATNAYTFSHGAETFSLTLWTAEYCIAASSTTSTTTGCASGTLPFSSWCGALDSRWRAMQAFSVLIVLYSAVMLVIGYAAVDVERARPLTWDLLSRYVYPSRFVQIAGWGFWLFLLVEWALGAGTFHEAPCATTVSTADSNRLLGVRSLYRSGFKLSASWALNFVMWFYWGFLLVWWWYKKLDKHYKSEPAPSPAAANKRSSSHGSNAIDRKSNTSATGGALVPASSAVAGNGQQQALSRPLM